MAKIIKFPPRSKFTPPERTPPKGGLPIPVTYQITKAAGVSVA